MKLIDTIALTWLAAINVVTFLTFGYDKWRAGTAKQRVSEFTLVLLGTLGGWPGGLLGMSLFRHKTAKWTFKFKYALALVPFVVETWAWLHWR